MVVASDAALEIKEKRKWWVVVCQRLTINTVSPNAPAKKT